MTRTTTASRQAFTAIELLAVLAIAGVVSAMAVPAVLPALRQGRVNQASEQVLTAWNLARDHARARTMPTAGSATPHYGLALIQDADGTTVALVHAAADAATVAADLERHLLRADPADPSLDDAVNPPVYRVRFPAGAVLATGRDGATLDTGPQAWVVYSSYGSGTPLTAADVAAGGISLPPAGFGVSGGPHPERVLVQSPDYDGTRGSACALGIYHMGVAACEDR